MAGLGHVWTWQTCVTFGGFMRFALTLPLFFHLAELLSDANHPFRPVWTAAFGMRAALGPDACLAALPAI